MPELLGSGIHEMEEVGRSYRFVVTDTCELCKYTTIAYTSLALPSTFYEVLYGIIDVLEYLHINGFIYSCVTPSDILLKERSLHRSPRVFLVNYTLTFKMSNTSRDVAIDSKGGEFMQFHSIDLQKRSTVTRRGDLESLCYTIIYACSGSLPWSSAPADEMIESKKRYRRYSNLWEKWLSPDIALEIVVSILGLLKFTYSLRKTSRVDYSRLHPARVPRRDRILQLRKQNNREPLGCRGCKGCGESRWIG